MLVSLAPAMVSLVPGIELKGILVVVPLVNIVLLARDLLADEWVIDTAALAIGVTLLYAGSALAVAAKLFGGDAVMRTSEQSFKSLLRRPSRLANSPSFTQAAFVLAILVPCYFVVSNGLMLVLKQYGDVITVNWQLGLNGLSLALTFGLLPIAASWWNRCRFVTTYQIETPSLFAMVGSVLMGLGCWVFAHELFVFADAIGIGGLGDAQIQAAMAMIERMRQAPVWLLLLVFAVAPAVVEEVCFRGFFFTAIRGTLRPLWVITFTAMVFGLFHVLTGNALLVERFLPSTLMGLVIGWVAYKTGSIFPGMLIHFVHNALLNTVLYYADQLAFLGEGFDGQTHLPLQWLALGAVSVTTGAILVHLGSKK
jgi:sodium transport system permease protein